ncbi:MAG TPA: tRNA (adenosine(37)-N6)-threonylcarbamoyltransferase complex ATPase subunit type 1 TsaE [Acidimicrobiales bacterium]|nr:tRNA (adenosine(37)-N6)-threonylcarbamoyltransferase complex ATPase subunit type 1 TsaE [Acidimicrobiales bacterium]
MTGRWPDAMVRCRTTDVGGTRALAGAVAGLCVPGDIVLLAGDLGAGKTAFAQGFGAALGVEEPITSPTFALLRQYPCDYGAIRTLLHADVYRLDHLQEVVDLGLGELVEDGGVAVVEWGDVAEPVLGSGSLTVHIVADPAASDPAGADPAASDPVGASAAGAGDAMAAAADENARSIAVAPIGTAWDGRSTRLATALAPWAVPA